MSMSHEESKAAGQKRMTKANWRRAEAKWKSGNYTLDDLAAEFGVHRNSLSRHFKKRQIEKGEDDPKYQKVEMDAHQKAFAEAAKEMASEGMQVKRNTIRGTLATQRMTMKLVQEVVSGQKTLSGIHDDVKALKDISAIMGSTYKNAEAVMHYDREETDEDDLPELIVNVMDDDDVNDIREAQRLEASELGEIGDLG